MKAKSRQFALTLPELIVVIASIVVLAGLGLPAVRALFTSFESGSSTKAVISGALATARAIAAREHRYAGIRFQKAYNPVDALEADQYVIFIVQDPCIGAYFFRAVEGIKPIKLPQSVGVMDFTIVTGHNVTNPVHPGGEIRLDNPLLPPAQKNLLIDAPHELMDMSSFSVIFSPSGKLVIHGVRVRRSSGSDDVFNIGGGPGMFYQDDYFTAPNLGLGPEPSRNGFYIYDRKEFRQAYAKGQAFTGYLQRLVPQERIHINPYMGTMISRD